MWKRWVRRSSCTMSLGSDLKRFVDLRVPRLQSGVWGTRERHEQFVHLGQVGLKLARELDEEVDHAGDSLPPDLANEDAQRAARHRNG